MPTSSSTNDRMHSRTALADSIFVVGSFISARSVRRPLIRLRWRICERLAVLVANARSLADAGGIPVSQPALPAREGERG